MTQSNLLVYLKHLGILAGLGAISIVLVTVLQTIGALNLSTLPLAWQGVAFIALPVIVAAAQRLQAEIAADIAAQNAATALAVSQSKVAELQAKLTVSPVNTVQPSTGGSTSS